MKVSLLGRDGWTRRALRRVTPLRVRRILGVSAFRSWRRIRHARARLPEILGRVPVLAMRELVYDDGYYERADSQTQALYGRMVDALMELRSPGSVVDIGCGSGVMLRRFSRRQVVVRGVDGSLAAIRRSRIGDRIVRANLERGVPDLGRFDLCLCIEVGEHLREASAPRLVEGLSRLSDVVVFTAAPPDQEGTAHINPQRKGYWTKLFARHGFRRSRLERELREAIEDIPEPRYIHSNLMVFERSRAIAA